MAPAWLVSWTRTRLRRDASGLFLMAPLAGLIALPCIGIAYLFWWVALGVGWESLEAVVSIAGGDLHLRSAWRWTAWAAWLPTLLVFVTAGRPHCPGEEDYSEFDGHPGTWQSHLGLGHVPVRHPLGLLIFPRASSRMILEILAIGPRLLIGAVAWIREGLARLRLDPEPLSAVLAVLLERGRKVSFEDLAGRFPEGDGAAQVGQVRWIDGVSFLETGITLGDELRQELVEACRAAAAGTGGDGTPDPSVPG